MDKWLARLGRCGLERAIERQPDIAVLQPRPDRYRGAHPEPAEVFLLIEVSDTTLDLDRRVKVLLYSAANVTELWIVDLANEAVEVYREPDAQGYRHIRRHGRGDSLDLSAFPDVALAVDDVLGATAPSLALEP